MIYHHQLVPAAPSRVVVLGGSGFVGGDLVAFLHDQRIPVIGYASRDVDLLRSESVELLRQIVRHDDVLVFASTVTPDKGKDVRTLMKNLTMGEHVAAFVEQSVCRQVVYVSSDAVYDDAANPVREDSACNPGSFHGVMHLARELMLRQAMQKSKTPLMCIRATLLYGENDTHNGYGPNRFLRTARMEQLIKIFGQGEEKRDHLHIGDLSKLIGLCLRHRSEGILNAATGHSTSFREIADLIAEQRPGTRLECLPRATPITHRHFDTTALLRAFPTMHFTPLQAGLTAMLATSGTRAAA
jgi:nucleoside-diphosphate-sugar epimerase